eukprot:TRINITY_DN11550_c0_g1_i1.p1 TRINITY_DN11550_c0_g1~~TRINITY_DN11550_c0_g1_i1.p1  ORF type:complete len:410 (-),score=98.15 TRINITY_DN11550_c0_g1_i1:94-1323(-)
MITIRNARDVSGQLIPELKIPAAEGQAAIDFDASGLTLLPALIDPHVHFRVPGQEYKEDWRTASRAAIRGGVTTVLDMPNNIPCITSLERIKMKKEIIDTQLKEAGIPLRYHLYIGADRNCMDQLSIAKGEYVAIKMFMGASTGELLVDDEPSQEAIFKIAGELGVIVAVHAEDECILKHNKSLFPDTSDIAVHSKIRDRHAASAAVKKAIEYSRKHNAACYVLHSSTRDEIELIREAKKEGVKIYCETTPHHLFLDIESYNTLGSKVQVNPPIREHSDVDFLWEAIRDGVIDTIGTDHAPHTLEEKALPYGQSPSGIPSIELYLPLLLDAAKKGKITLEKIVEVTSTNPRKMFNFPETQDFVLVNLDLSKKVLEEELQTKVKWSPYTGQTLVGWPIATICDGRFFHPI